MGLDIGGTLTKIVIASKPGESPLASLAHTTSTQKVELAFDTAQASFHFLSLPTHTLKETAESIRRRLGWADSDVAVRQIVAGAVWKLANSRDAS